METDLDPAAQEDAEPYSSLGEGLPQKFQHQPRQPHGHSDSTEGLGPAQTRPPGQYVPPHTKAVQEDETEKMQQLQEDLARSDVDGSVIERYWYCLKPELQIDHHDGVILYYNHSEEDTLGANKILEHILTEVKLRDGETPKVALFDQVVPVGPSMTPLDMLDPILKRCTFKFLYITENFCRDNLSMFSSSVLLHESLHDINQMWSVVPIFTAQKFSCKYSIPSIIRSLRGVDFFSGSKFPVRDVTRLIQSKAGYRKEQEEVIGEERRNAIRDAIQQEQLRLLTEKLEKQKLSEKHRLAFEEMQKQVSTREFTIHESQQHPTPTVTTTGVVFSPTISYSAPGEQGSSKLCASPQAKVDEGKGPNTAQDTQSKLTTAQPNTASKHSLHQAREKSPECSQQIRKQSSRETPKEAPEKDAVLLKDNPKQAPKKAPHQADVHQQSSHSISGSGTVSQTPLPANRVETSKLSADQTKSCPQQTSKETQEQAGDSRQKETSDTTSAPNGTAAAAGKNEMPEPRTPPDGQEIKSNSGPSGQVFDLNACPQRDGPTSLPSSANTCANTNATSGGAATTGHQFVQEPIMSTQGNTSNGSAAGNSQTERNATSAEELSNENLTTDAGCRGTNSTGPVCQEEGKKTASDYENLMENTSNGTYQKDDIIAKAATNPVFGSSDTVPKSMISNFGDGCYVSGARSAPVLHSGAPGRHTIRKTAAGNPVPLSSCGHPVFGTTTHTSSSADEDLWFDASETCQTGGDWTSTSTFNRSESPPPPYDYSKQVLVERHYREVHHHYHYQRDPKPDPPVARQEPSQIVVNIRRAANVMVGPSNQMFTQSFTSGHDDGGDGPCTSGDQGAVPTGPVQVPGVYLGAAGTRPKAEEPATEDFKDPARMDVSTQADSHTDEETTLTKSADD